LLDTCELIVLLDGMHELSITQGILSVVLEQAEANQASKITKIDLTIGELSGIASECVEFYFNLLSKNTIAAEASLAFHRTPIKLRCRNCDDSFFPDSLNWTCPNCREPNVEIVTGRECSITSIEVD
jgi:hydrogenase nickel incorporation protein HypA/HybF